MTPDMIQYLIYAGIAAAGFLLRHKWPGLGEFLPSILGPSPAIPATPATPTPAPAPTPVPTVPSASVRDIVALELNRLLPLIVKALQTPPPTTEQTPPK